jgi:hypothetical protein
MVYAIRETSRFKFFVPVLILCMETSPKYLYHSCLERRFPSWAIDIKNNIIGIISGRGWQTP